MPIALELKKDAPKLDSTALAASKRTGRYYVEVLGKALDVLDVLRGSRTELRLTDIAEKANLDVTTTFRLLRTLEERGYVLRDTKTKRFKHRLGFRTYRIGYAQLSSDQDFSRKLTQGLLQAADKAHVELVVTDNHGSPEDAVKNATWLISQKVDFVIEYQFHHRAGPVIADMFRKAGIPTLAIDIPMPNATYFGVDNYAAGVMGGHALAGFARTHWRGNVDRILLLEITEAGPVPQARVLGTIDGMKKVFPKLNERSALHKNGKGTEMGGYLATRRVLGSLAENERMLIAAANDCCAMGAIRAVRETGREKSTAIMAQGWGPDLVLDEELSKPDTPLIGAVAYFPEKYGSKILPIALQVLNGQPVPPAVYIEPRLIPRA
jgi:ribose transport system substrate-binding protein